MNEMFKILLVDMKRILSYHRNFIIKFELLTLIRLIESLLQGHINTPNLKWNKFEGKCSSSSRSFIMILILYVIFFFEFFIRLEYY